MNVDKVLLALFAMTFVSNAKAAGTINLSLDAARYCATSRVGDAFSGVTTGVCATPPPTSCPPGRFTLGSVSYNYNLSAANTARNVDLTRADNIWGRISPTDPIVGFPWKNTFAVLQGFPKTGYVAAQFMVPAWMPDTNLTGLFTHGETLPGPNVTMSISTRCGDFNPPDAICIRQNMGPGSILTKYKLPGTAGYACPVAPGGTYFVNFKFTSPPAAHPDCSAISCKVTIQNNH
jgi:hypothetical protein